MLFHHDMYPRLADGTVTLAFRRWKRPRVRAGTRLRTWVGVLAVESIEPIEPDAITAADARLAGARDRAEVLRVLEGREGTVYRIELRFAGADPRAALRERDDLSDGELREVIERLAWLDQTSRKGPWTETTLRLIEERPAVRAADLAASMDRDRDPFKADVRKLKELGLTESLEVGYRLSPRGRAVLSAIEASEAAAAQR